MLLYDSRHEKAEGSETHTCDPEPSKTVGT